MKGTSAKGIPAQNPQAVDEKAYADGLDRIIDNDLFKILSEPSRVKILRFLAITGPSDVGTVSRAFTQDRSVISRHLKIMADAEILSAEKKSRNTVYTFDGYAFLRRLEDITGMVKTMLDQFCPDCREGSGKKD